MPTNGQTLALDRNDAGPDGIVGNTDGGDQRLYWNSHTGPGELFGVANTMHYSKP